MQREPVCRPCGPRVRRCHRLTAIGSGARSPAPPRPTRGTRSSLGPVLVLGGKQSDVTVPHADWLRAARKNKGLGSRHGTVNKRRHPLFLTQTAALPRRGAAASPLRHSLPSSASGSTTGNRTGRPHTRPRAVVPLYPFPARNPASVLLPFPILLTRLSPLPRLAGGLATGLYGMWRGRRCPD